MVVNRVVLAVMQAFYLLPQYAASTDVVETLSMSAIAASFFDANVLNFI
jgi:hypothetical protein